MPVYLNNIAQCLSKFRPATVGRSLFYAALLLLAFAFLWQPAQIIAANPNGDLRIEVMAAPNFIVDSNVESPSTYAPESATIGAKFCNDGDNPLVDVFGYIGNFDPNGDLNASDSTPGIYPARTHTGLAGTFSLVHEGGSAGTNDARRYVGTLAPGACQMQYWVVSYPRLDANGNTVTGGIKPDDDLWLEYDVWATAVDGGTPLTADQTTKATMRNEISAAANKIWPNGDNKVPDIYKDAINEVLGWNTITPSGDTAVYPGDSAVLKGVWYDLGNVGFGFDNNGDLIPDKNAWVQPVGDPASYDPGCFRLVRTYGIIIVKLKGGGEHLIPFVDQLYFEGIPDNTGAVGLVFYEYAALDGVCRANLTPYQEVASGFDNEKFNGDYGVSLPPVVSHEPTVTLDKQVDQSVIGPTLPATLTYTLAISNTGPVDVGHPSIGLPLVIEEEIPANTNYITGTAAINNTLPAGVGSYTILYSADNGNSWSQTEPPAATVTNIQWWLSDSLAAGAGGDVTFRVSVPAGYTGAVVPNTAQLSFGFASPFAEDTAVTRIAGINQIGDTIFADDGSGGGSQGNGVQDGSEAGLSGITVSLYYDEDGDGKGDFLLETDTTDGSGNYLFTGLADGRYVVQVDATDAALPTGYAPTTETVLPVNLDITNTDSNPVTYLDADMGFSPALLLQKTLTSLPPAYEGRLVTYSIDVTNAMPDGSFQPEYWATEAIAGSEFEATVADNANNVIGEPDNIVNSQIIDWPEGLVYAGMVKGTGFQVDSCGAITKVEALYQIELDGLLSNDFIWGTIQLNGTAWYNFTVNTATANANYAVPGGALLAVDITSSNAGHLGSVTDWATWDNAPANELQLGIGGDKETNADKVGLLVDAIGVRITNDGTSCTEFTSDTVLNPVPLSDTYDPAKLTFVSADVTPTSVDSGTGTITWTNVGPVNPGETQTINVTFKAQEPIGNVSETITNTAVINNAFFINGQSANDASDDAVTTLSPTGSIAGKVWSEGSGGTSGWVAGNGYEGVDLSIPNVTVELYGCVNGSGTPLDPATASTNQSCTGSQNGGTWGLIATTSTDSSGNYLFEGLLNGFYTVHVVSTTLPGTVTQTAEAGTTNTNQASGGRTCGTCDNIWGLQSQNLNTTNFNPINTAGENITNVNFGYTVNPAIYGVIWEDSDGDGIRDTGEDSLGAGITITRTDNLGNSATTVTLGDGSYKFPNLTAGRTYTVTVSAGTLPGTGWSNTADPDGTTNGQYVVGVLSAGQISGSHDFGYHQTGTAVIGDTIYYDWDGDGFQDSGEEGIPGVTVTLYEDSNGDGILNLTNDAVIITDTTDINGNYAFTNLPPGDYIVVTQMPANTVATGDPDESGQCAVCDLRGAATGLTAGSTDNTLDFGFIPLGKGSIGDTVWLDKNGDGIQSGVQEVGLAYVTVRLAADLNGDAAFDIVLTEVTDSNGNYLFNNLPDGNYEITVDLTDPDLPKDGVGNPYVPTTVTQFDVTLSGGSYLDADFGFAPLGAIGDTIYWDANGDGEYDWNEAGIPGVVITLTNALTQTLVIDGVSYAPGAVITTKTTDGNGRYLFSALPPAKYGVTVGPISGSPVLTGDPEADGVPCTDPGAVGCDGATTVTIRYGTSFMGADFGYQAPGAFGDYVWFDQNGDGVQDSGEIGISGLVVTATTSTNVTVGGISYPAGTTITTTTDYDGYYSFDNLISVGSSATWTVSVETPASMSPTYDADGTVDASTTVTIDTSGTVTAVGGSTCTNCFLTVDFGFEMNGPYSLTGSVCLEDDTASNRVCGDGSDVSVGGYQVYLYNDGGMYLGTTVTDPSGVYTFTNLIDDTYFVAISETLPPLDAADLVTTASDTPASAITQNVSSVYQTVAVNATTTAGDGGSDANAVEAVDFAYLTVIDYDFGDLPQSYNTTLEGNPSGPRHEVPTTPTLYLGTEVPDSELNGTPDVAASSDGSDEDGVTPINIQSWTDGTDGGSVSVDVVGSGWLVGWIDFNDDGDFTDSGEMIADQAVSTGNYTITFDIPAGTMSGSPTDFYGRFRLFSTQPAFSVFAYNGPASAGEVEDYSWLTSENPVIGIAKQLVDVSGNGDGSYTVIYGLVVENLGDVVLQDVQVTDNLSTTFATASGFAVSSVTSDLFTVNVPGYDGSSNVNLLAGTDSLALNATAQITLTAVITPGGSLGTFNNSAIASGDSPGGTPTQDTSDNGIDPDPDGGGDPNESGENDPTPLLFAAVDGHIFEDTNGNGTQELGEPNLQNVDVVITDVDGNTQTVTTDANGNYTAVVPAGSTTANVDETTLPAGSVQTAGTDPTTVTAVAGSSTDIGDDGYQPRGTVSGHLYIDTNGNGTQDTGEPDLANVNVVITNTFGITQTVSTDSNGNWTATVPAGSTTADVDETDPDYPSGHTQTEGTDPTTVTAAAGTNTSAGNDGYYQSGTVSGHLYIDTNGNGAQDTGEPDLANVDVIITASTGVTQTVTTDANGNWTATVPPGSTIADVDETDTDYPTGYTQTEGNDPTTVTAVAGTNTSAGVDGYYQATTVYGHLYLDTNGNGTQDSGEPDLANVDLIITRSDSVTQTVTTDANGDWSAIVLPGSTTADVDETDPDYPSGYTQTEGTDPTTVTAVLGTNVSAGNDGYYQPGTVSGHLYIDANGNGSQDGGEPNLANVDVIITASTGVTQTVTTDANGNWTATVPPGSTIADVDETDTDYPTGYTQTEGNDPTTVTAVAGTDTSAGNDGYYQSGTVSGHLYIDTNGNGSQDGGEPNLANVDVIITASTGVTQTVTTDANGDWTATVPPGSTIADVDETDTDYPTGYTQTEGNDPTTVTAVAGTDTPAGIDGYHQPAVVNGHLFIDSNGNGTQDSGEPNLPNVDVVITDSNGITQTVTSDANGNYTATVPPGSTTANVDETTLPTGYVQTAGSDPTTVTAVAGTTTDIGDDGYQPQNAGVGDFIWLDLDADGMQDAGEPGLQNVTVNLYTGTGTFVSSTSSNAGGFYGFTNLVPGSYYVEFVLPSGYAFTFANSGGNDAVDSDANPVSGQTVVFTLTDGENEPTWDAGLYQIVRLGNRIWFDADNDGVLDAGEQGMANVLVELLNATGNPVFSPVTNQPITTSTDAAGRYVFDSIPPSTYIVRVAASNFDGWTDPLYGFVSSRNNVSPDPAADPDVNSSDVDDNGRNNADPANGGIVSYPVTLTVGNEPTNEGADEDGSYPNADSNLTVDFGFFELLTLGNTIWHDSNENGVIDSGEPGVSGVVVYLLDGSGNPVLHPVTSQPISAVTNGNGFYQFTNLYPGNYRVLVGAENFQAGGALEGAWSSPGAADPNNNSDFDDNGLDEVEPWVTGIMSQPVRLDYHQEPDNNDDGDDNDNTNLTVDMGFVATPTAVTLTSFTATNLGSQQVRIAWTTESEVDNFGFRIYRSSSNNFAGASLIHFEPTAVPGGSGPGASYSYTDTVPADGLYYYWLVDVETDDDTAVHGPITVNVTPFFNLYLPFVIGGN